MGITNYITEENFNIPTSQVNFRQKPNFKIEYCDISTKTIKNNQFLDDNIRKKATNLTEKDVNKEFAEFLSKCVRCQKSERLELVKKAYKLAKEAHKGQTRYNGDAFISHPVEVAKIVTLDIGLGTRSVIAALLHDVPTNTDIDIEEIEQTFGKEIAGLVKGLVHIKGTSEAFSVNKSDVYRKVLIEIASDLRIIYIKIADRLHNLRTAHSLFAEKKKKVAKEVLEIYVPLAERLGLYKIKSELEDLAFKILNPQEYQTIAQYIRDSEFKNIMYLNRVALPIIAKMRQDGFDFEITSRQKTVYSIASKMRRKHVKLNEVYDIFAIRIIYKPKTDNSETQDAYRIKQIIENIYGINPDRVRDWVRTPKLTTGYRAMHLTVKAFDNRWVEIQIRSEKMHEEAEFGQAAHWIYKGYDNKKSDFDEKIKELKEKLENVLTKNDTEDIDYSYDFQQFVKDDKIAVLTPKGDVIMIDKGSTVLDFAFAIHSKLGFQAIGANIGRKSVPLYYQLHHNDQVNIIRSEKQQPKLEWLNFVKTRKARKALHEYFGLQNTNEKENGQKIIEDICQELNIFPDSTLISSLIKHFNTKNKVELYIKIGSGEIDKKELKNYIRKTNKWKFNNFFKLISTSKGKNIREFDDFEVATCCNPIPGDEVIGIKDPTKQKLIIHQKDCKQISENERKKSFQLTWQVYRKRSYYAKLEIEAENQVGIFYNISRILANDFSVNIKSLYFDTIDNVSVSGWMEIYVLNQSHLNRIISQISAVNGVTKVQRIKN